MWPLIVASIVGWNFGWGWAVVSLLVSIVSSALYRVVP
jgi:hypothetical protein